MHRKVQVRFGGGWLEFQHRQVLWTWPPTLRDGVRLAGQDEEGGLERVLGVLLIAEHPPARTPHRRAVPADDLSKGVLRLPPHALPAGYWSRGSSSVAVTSISWASPGTTSWTGRATCSAQTASPLPRFQHSGH